MVKERSYIGMHFKCCNVYTRLHINHAGTAYSGNCPKCCAKVTVKITPGGKRTHIWSAE